MSNFLKITLAGKNVNKSKITGELLDDIEYSKLGKNPFEVPKSQLQSQSLSKIEQLSAESLRHLKEDWKNICLDFTQLGLTVVGLVEVAVPVQIGADLTNGAIDVARGHPYIGALSMMAAIPIAGLLTGIPLTLIRAFKCVWSCLKFIGRCFIVLAVKGIVVPIKFIYLKKGIILNFIQKSGKFIQNTGKDISNGLPEVTETILKNIKDFGEQLAKKPSTRINASPQIKSPTALEKQLGQSLSRTKAADEAQRNINVYRMYPKTYGSMYPLSSVFKGPKL